MLAATRLAISVQFCDPDHSLKSDCSIHAQLMPSERLRPENVMKGFTGCGRLGRHLALYRIDGDDSESIAWLPTGRRCLRNNLSRSSDRSALSFTANHLMRRARVAYLFGRQVIGPTARWSAQHQGDGTDIHQLAFGHRPHFPTLPFLLLDDDFHTAVFLPALRVVVAVGLVIRGHRFR